MIEQGEYWLDEHGNQTFADGDVGDVNHEAVAYCAALGLPLEPDGFYDGPEFQIGERIFMYHPGDLGEDADGNDIPITKQNCLYLWVKNHGAPKAALTFFGKENADAREYAVRYMGWTRVKIHNAGYGAVTTQIEVDIAKLDQRTLDNLRRADFWGDEWDDRGRPEGASSAEVYLNIVGGPKSKKQEMLTFRAHHLFDIPDATMLLKWARNPDSVIAAAAEGEDPDANFSLKGLAGAAGELPEGFQVEAVPDRYLESEAVTVTATVAGAPVGHVLFVFTSQGTLTAVNVQVDPEWRRRGVATAMYAEAERVTGRRVRPSRDQSDYGRCFWRGLRAKGLAGCGCGLAGEVVDFPDLLRRDDWLLKKWYRVLATPGSKVWDTEHSHWVEIVSPVQERFGSDMVKVRLWDIPAAEPFWIYAWLLSYEPGSPRGAKLYQFPSGSTQGLCGCKEPWRPRSKMGRKAAVESVQKMLENEMDRLQTMAISEPNSADAQEWIDAAAGLRDAWLAGDVEALYHLRGGRFVPTWEQLLMAFNAMS